MLIAIAIKLIQTVPSSPPTFFCGIDLGNYLPHPPQLPHLPLLASIHHCKIVRVLVPSPLYLPMPNC